MTSKEVLLVDGDCKLFIPRTEKYGCAEFTFCTTWKRRKLQDVFIYPRQQENIDYFYHVKAGYSTDFHVSSWIYKGFEEPRTWRYYWCPEHKCMSMDVYPPKGTDSFRVSILSSFYIYFENIVEL